MPMLVTPPIFKQLFKKRCLTQIIPVIWLQCSFSYLLGITKEAVMHGMGVRKMRKQDMLFYHQCQHLMVFKPLFRSPGLETTIHLPLILLSKMKLLKGSGWTQSPSQLDHIWGLKWQNHRTAARTGPSHHTLLAKQVPVSCLLSKHACLLWQPVTVQTMKYFIAAKEISSVFVYMLSCI